MKIKFTYTPGLDNISYELNKKNEIEQERTEVLKEISRNEINAKDRVDIQKDEYLAMLEKIKYLEQENENYKTLCGFLKIEKYINRIDFNSIDIRACKNPMNLKQKVLVEFIVRDITDLGVENVKV